MPFPPTLPKSEMKVLIIKEPNSQNTLIEVKKAIKEMLLKHYQVENLNMYPSLRENKHIAIITYYE